MLVQLRILILITLFLFGILIPMQLSSQCPVGSVTLSSQSEVDDFIINFPNCTQLDANLRIQGADIVNLNGLSNLIYLNNGLLLLSNTALASLDGLHNVERIEGGGLAILSSDLLTNLEGLSSLQHIDGQLQLEGNLNMVNLSGLELLDSITGQLFIYNNPLVADISALENLNHIGGSLIITLSPFLSDCSINSICDYVENPNGAIVVSTNGVGCNNQQEIENGCDDCVVDNVWQGPFGGHWHVSSNWSLSEVPSDCHHVIVPAGSEMKVLAGMTATAYTMTVSINAVFETEPTAHLNLVVEGN